MALSMLSVTQISAQQTNGEFEIVVVNINNDDEIQQPHRGSTNEDVYGTFDAFTGSLCLSASFDIACVRIYQDNVLIMEENYPVMYDGAVYYNLSFYGSGAYRVCLYDEEGNSYIAYMEL